MKRFENSKKIIGVACAISAIVLVWGGLSAQGPGPGGGRMQGAMFAAMDADQDGKVSRAEWDAFHAAKFAQIDANGDGSIDLAEFKAKRKKGKGKKNR